MNHSQKQKQSPLFRLFKLGIWILVIGGIVFYNKYSTAIETVLVDKDTSIFVEKGDTLSNLYTKFIDENQSPLIGKNYYKLYRKLHPQKVDETGLQAGEYLISSGSTLETLFPQLEQPIQQDEISLTILEGWNIFDIDEYLSNKGLVATGDFSKYAQEEGITDWKESYPFLEKALTLEGFLYPDSYRIFTKNFSPSALVVKMLNNFDTKVYQPLMQEMTPEEMYETVNLASIVEKEEKNNNEKATVAGILKKRLEDNWQIGADATVCYPHNLTSEECKMVVSEYITEKSDYNTRTMTGLPKTPIGNPQVSSINAVIHPNMTQYWFYLHNTNTGEIYYAKTNAEHEANKQYLYK